MFRRWYKTQNRSPSIRLTVMRFLDGGNLIKLWVLQKKFVRNDESFKKLFVFCILFFIASKCSWTSTKGRTDKSRTPAFARHQLVKSGWVKHFKNNLQQKIFLVHIHRHLLKPLITNKCQLLLYYRKRATGKLFCRKRYINISLGSSNFESKN